MSVPSPYSSSEFKRSTLHFLAGKAASALLSLIILLLLVRLLPTKEYGAYVVFVAGMEITLAITALGLPWVSARYLPEFRLYANGKMLIHFVWQIIAWISLFLIAGALLLLAAVPWLLPSELAQYTDAAKLYLLLLLIEGLGRYIRESILGPLMQQGRAQISQVLRNLAFLLLIGIEISQGAVHLYYVVFAELVASLLGTILALHGLIQYLQMYRDLQGKDGWQSPKWSEMWRVARYMYLGNLITQTYNPQVFVFLIQRYLGLEAAALFGFLRNLYVQVTNYLPAALLSNLIRPKLVASFVGERGMTELTRNTNLVGKLSMFVLMPILIFVWLAGSELTSLLSGGKFDEADYYLAGLLLALVPLSQRQLLEIVAVISEKSHLCSWGAVMGVLVLPMAYLLLESGQGLWSVIILIVMSQILFSGTLIIVLTHTTTYRFDFAGFFKLIVAAVIGFTFAQRLPLSIQSWLDLFLMAIFSCGLFLLISYFIKPFYRDERERLNRLLNRKVFIW
ncbi:MAG: oligosaccharide flippase family protein [Gammaproteobacteria bacterium]|nr:MAG: oligosaccharide flippase family protein [Gammaproteobacteria bacterium]